MMPGQHVARLCAVFGVTDVWDPLQFFFLNLQTRLIYSFVLFIYLLMYVFIFQWKYINEIQRCQFTPPLCPLPAYYEMRFS